MGNSNHPVVEIGVVGAVGIGLAAIQFAIFSSKFPNHQGGLGHDWALFLPRLLDGYFWSEANGYLSVPWFTPSFCGGVPKFPNPQSLYYSLPQILTIWTGPITAIRLTFATGLLVGFFSFYQMMRGVYRASRPIAVLAAALFLFNGLFLSRMWIGHLTFHAFMFAPLVFLFVLREPERENSGRSWKLVRDLILAGWVIAYFVHTAAAHLLPQLLLMTTILATVRILLDSTYSVSRFFLRFAGATGIALALSAAKVVAVLSYLRHFPRTLYSLPGIDSFADLFSITIQTLLLTPPGAQAARAVVNARWSLGHHEWNFGLTIVPLCLIALALLTWAKDGGWRRNWRALSRRQALAAAALIAALAFPIAINYYTPAWNALLKTLPILGSSSNLFRWLSVYMPFLIVAATLSIEWQEPLRALRLPISIVGMGAIVVLNVAPDRSAYDSERYDPTATIDAYSRVSEGAWEPRITTIAKERDAAGQADFLGGRNESLALGASQLNCYEALFGYRLESFPRKSLHVGSILDETDGLLNLKRPSCYVYPEENGCAPGDHFETADREKALAFAAYRPLPFQFSALQKRANQVSLWSLILSILLVCVAIGGRMRATPSP